MPSRSESALPTVDRRSGGGSTGCIGLCSRRGEQRVSSWQPASGRDCTVKKRWLSLDGGASCSLGLANWKHSERLRSWPRCSPRDTHRKTLQRLCDGTANVFAAPAWKNGFQDFQCGPLCFKWVRMHKGIIIAPDALGQQSLSAAIAIRVEAACPRDCLEHPVHAGEHGLQHLQLRRLALSTAHDRSSYLSIEPGLVASEKVCVTGLQQPCQLTGNKQQFDSVFSSRDPSLHREVHGRTVE